MRTMIWLISANAAVWCSALVAEDTSIGGVVYDDAGKPFDGAPILVTNDANGSRVQTRSSADGAYQIAGLEPGTYRLSISMPCCAFESYRQEGIQVSPSKPVRVDVHLARGSSLRTFGDDPATIADVVRARQDVPDEPVPKAANGRTDLTGVWLVGHDEFPVDPKPLAWAAEIGRRNKANFGRDHPHTRCLPGDVPFPSGGSPFIVKLVQTDDLLIVLLEDVPGYRQVFLDGRAHPTNPNPSWMGHSIGRWDGDALVVDTIGFNGRGWIGPYPSSENLRMTERYRRTAYGTISLEVTFEDPRVFEEPWVQRMELDLAPQEELIEYVCENNKWATK
jgi:hypothetical protein